MRDGGDCTEPPYAWVIGITTTAELRKLAIGLGAASFGVTGPQLFTESRAVLTGHKASGLSGPLHFTYDHPEVATDIRSTFPWARSIVSFAHDYLSDAVPPAPTGAVVARFATSDHYESVSRIAHGLAAHLGSEGHRAEILIDDNRLVDRAAAARSGVGWIGKSTMVLAPGHGPWMLLGSVVTDTGLEPTEPMRRDCGTCVACIPTCPTGAITEAGLDARRCLSTWLQTAGSIPHWIRPFLGRRIYGCDECLVSCPPGARALETTPAESSKLDFADLLALTDDQLLEQFSWWYVPRRDGRFIRRNLLVAAGNSGEPEAVPAIRQHLAHPSSMIRGHAAWALARSLGSEARGILEMVMNSETVKEPINEIELALRMINDSPQRP